MNGWVAFVLPIGMAGAQAVKVPVEVKDGLVYEHRIGPEQALHMTPEFHAKLQKSPMERDGIYFEYEVVVSAEGLVESIKLVRPQGVPSEEADAVQRARVYKPWIVDGAPARVKIEDCVAYLPPERWGPAVPFPARVDRGTLEMGLKRTRCEGTCPAYQVTVRGDGTVIWDGGDGSPTPGHHLGHISGDAVTDLLDRFRKAEFLSALPRYHSNWTDNPTQTLTLRMGETRWTVVDYDGLKDGLPLAVRNLEEELDEAAGVSVWLKGGSGLLQALKAEKWDFGAATADNVALYTASLHDPELVEEFLKAKAPVTLKVGEVPVPLCAASKTTDVDLVRRMLEGVKRLPEGIADTCLARAAGSKSLGMVDLWVAKGGDVAARSRGWGDQAHPARVGPLENAVDWGDAAIVRRLLDLKADANGPTSIGEPMLTLAVQYGGRQTLGDKAEQGLEIVGELIRAGADVNARGNMGRTALHHATWSPDAVKTLVVAGADVDARDNNGDTPLLSNIYLAEMVKELLAAGADAGVVSKNGETTVERARHSSCEPCVTMLEEALRKKNGAAK